MLLGHALALDATVREATRDHQVYQSILCILEAVQLAVGLCTLDGDSLISPCQVNPSSLSSATALDEDNEPRNAGPRRTRAHRDVVDCLVRCQRAKRDAHGTVIARAPYISSPKVNVRMLAYLLQSYYLHFLDTIHLDSRSESSSSMPLLE